MNRIASPIKVLGACLAILMAAYLNPVHAQNSSAVAAPAQISERPDTDALAWLLAFLGLVLVGATLEGLVRSFVLRLPYDWSAYAA